MKIEYGNCILGVDYSIPPHKLPPGALADSKNIIMTDEGLPTGRGGQTKYNNTSVGSRITSFHEFKNGSTIKHLSSYGGSIGEYSTATGEFVNIISGLTSDQMFQWVNFGGKAIGANGTDPLQYWDGSTGGALAGSPPVGQAIAEWSNRLWIADGSTLAGSELNNPVGYTSAGTATGAVSQTIGDSGDDIVGMFGYFDYFLIGKRNNIYKVEGNPPTDATTLKFAPLYSRARENDNVGFTSKWAITQVGNDVLFLDGFDIKSLRGVQEFGNVEYSSAIPHFREYLESICDKDRLQYSHFYHYKNKQQVWVTMPTGASTHYVFIMDYKFKKDTGRYAIFPMGEIVANVFGGVENGVNTDIYYGDESGFVRRLDVSDNDDGSAIERYFTNVFHGGSDIRRKQFLNSETTILPEQASLTMTPYYAVDIFSASSVRDSSNYTSLSIESVESWFGSGAKKKRVGLLGISGHSMALKWAHQTVAQNFVFYPSVVNCEWKTENAIV